MESGDDPDERLLLKSSGREENGSSDGTIISFRERLWIENKKMWLVAGPAIFTKFSSFGINVVSLAFIGHIGSRELAAYALITTVLLRFGNGILLGMASALETLCGQAYGAKQYHMLGIYLQRSWIVLSVCAFCILPVFVLATPLLKAVVQDEVIAGVAGTVSMWFIPALFSFIASFTCQMFLQAQSKIKVISFLSAVSLLIHIWLSWLWTVKYKFGLPGAMASTVIACWIPNLGQLAFVIFGGCPETWEGFSILAFKDLWSFVKLSLSSGAMLCLELWYYTILILLTGKMENAEVAIDALSICLNINGWEMMTALGFLAAASVRVSNELGRGSSKDAKFAIKNIVLTSLAIGFVLFVVFLFFRENLAYIFTDSREVAAAVADLSPLLATSILLSSVEPVLSGVMIGAGLQSTVAYVNIASYYVIGVPVGLILGYSLGLHVEGVWMGMIFGTFLQTVILIVLAYKTDWENQVSIAKNRMNKFFVEDDLQVSNNTNQQDA